MGETTRTVKTGNGSPDEIREEISRSQARVGETLEEIERRLSPRRVFERAREAAERAVGDRGRRVMRQVDELGRGRVAGGAVGSLTAVWLLARGLRGRRGDANGRPEMTRIHSSVDPDVPAVDPVEHGDESSLPGPWTGALALLGAVGLMLGARYANRRDVVTRSDAASPAALSPEGPDAVQPVEHEHALPATQL